MEVYRRFRGAYCLHHQGGDEFSMRYIPAVVNGVQKYCQNMNNENTLWQLDELLKLKQMVQVVTIVKINVSLVTN
jgi:hypothetical protein